MISQNPGYLLLQDNWETTIFFEAIKIKKVKQKATLLVQVDTYAFKLIEQLIAPAKVGAKTCEKIVEVMKDYLNPKPSEVMEECNPNMARQDS